MRFNLQTVKVKTYKVNDVAVFKKTNERFGGLSNMCAGYGLNINGVIIPTAEHIYQACRYPLFPAVQNAIIKERSPMTAKMISKKYLSGTRQDWDNVRFSIMRWVLEIKLSQNWEKFSEVLRQTEDKPIVEVSHKDKFWAAVQTDSNTLVGVNALGRLLMYIRDRYVVANDHRCCIEPPNVVGLMLYGNPIGVVCDEPIMAEFNYSLSDDSCA